MSGEYYDSDLVVQSSDLSLMNIGELAKTGSLDLSPHFQRRVRWKRERQSKLIESFIINAPVPPVYLAEERQGKYAVIDGKQRLTAISNYLSGDFPLEGLRFLTNLNGLHFHELPAEIQSRLKFRPLRAVIVLHQTAEWMKFEVFLRLNTGGQPLNDQELRNVAFSGPLNDLLISLAGHGFLREQLKIRSDSSPAFAEMSDVEYVLRFFALSATWRTFNGDLSSTMDSFMKEHRQISERNLISFEKRFLRSIETCRELWGNNAFHRWDRTQGQWRNQLIGGVYDAEMIAVEELSDTELDKVLSERDYIQHKTIELFSYDESFDSSVRIGTNTPSKVRYRIETIANVLRSTLRR